MPAAPRVRSHRAHCAGRGVHHRQRPPRLPPPQSPLGPAGLRRCGDGPLHAPAFDAAGAEPAAPCDRPREIGRWFHAAASGGPPGIIRVTSTLYFRTRPELRHAVPRFPYELLVSRSRSTGPAFGAGPVPALVSSQPRRRARGGDGPRRESGGRTSTNHQTPTPTPDSTRPPPRSPTPPQPHRPRRPEHPGSPPPRAASRARRSWWASRSAPRLPASRPRSRLDPAQELVHRAPEALMTCSRLTASTRVERDAQRREEVLRRLESLELRQRRRSRAGALLGAGGHATSARGSGLRAGAPR